MAYTPEFTEHKNWKKLHPEQFADTGSLPLVNVFMDGVDQELQDLSDAVESETTARGQAISDLDQNLFAAISAESQARTEAVAAVEYPIVEVSEDSPALPRVTYLGNTTEGPFDLTITNPTIGDVFILINNDGNAGARFVFVVGDDTYRWGVDTENGKVVLEYTSNGMKLKEKRRG